MDTDPTDKQVVDDVWYMRPVFFVSNIHRASEFYVDTSGFINRWHELMARARCIG